LRHDHGIRDDPPLSGESEGFHRAFTDGGVRRLAPQGRVAETLVLG
jgi:hypothetical protein